MRVLWLANGINILLGPCLIFGLGPFPKMGVTGAATATTIGRGIGALFALSRLVLGKGRIQAHLRDLTPDRELLLRLVRLAASGTGQILIGTASWIALVRITSRFGSDALAGYTIGIRILLFALLPSFGMSNAAATMVGQALGSGNPERARRAAWTAGKYNLVALGAIAVVFVALAHPLAWLFSNDPTVIRHAAACLRTVALGFPLYAYGMVFTQAFNGAGDTTTPTWLNFVVFWLWEIPLAWALATVVGLGPEGVFASIAIAFSTLAIASGVLFQRGGWATRRV
jgi:putative MATE family efflux protein